MCKNYAKYILDNSKNQQDKIAIVDSDGAVTYGELTIYVKRLAYAFKKKNILPGDRVLITMDDCREWVISYLALMYIGAVPVAVSFKLPIEVMVNSINTAKASAIITCNGDLPIIDAEVIPRNSILLDHGPQLEQAYEFEPDEICFWITSSGTTGKSKFILHRHANLTIWREAVSHAICMDQSSRIFVIPKLSYSYGLHFTITMSLGLGATAIIIHQVPSVKVIHALVSTWNPTHLLTTPGIYASMLNQQHKPTDVLKDIGLVVSSGEYLPPKIKDQFKEIYGVTISEAYGTAEAVAMITLQRYDNNQGYNSGTPVPGTRYEIRDVDGSLVSPGNIGEIYICSPCAAIEYYNNYQKTKDTFVGHWMRTNDLGYQDDDGNLVYVSRVDDQIKIKGVFVSPLEVEDVLLQLDQVKDCVVIPYLNKLGLGELKTYIVTKLNQTLTARDVRQFLSKKLEGHKIPKMIEFVSDLPRTVNNKKIRNNFKKEIEMSDNKTKMLASVNCVEEALQVLESGVDIIDLKNPSQGALGALPFDLVREIVTAVDGRGILSATIGDLPMEVDIVKKGTEDMIATGVDIVKIGFFGTENHVDCIRALKSYADAGTKLVAVLFAENGNVVHLVPEFADAGFYGVMVDTAVKNGLTLTDHYDHDDIIEFVDAVKSHGMLVGLAGSIKLHHVKMLKPYTPSYLGFRGALCDNHQRTAILNVDKVKEIVEEMAIDYQFGV